MQRDIYDQLYNSVCADAQAAKTHVSIFMKMIFLHQLEISHSYVKHLLTGK